MTRIEYKYGIGDRVRHFDNKVEGKILGHTTLQGANWEGGCVDPGEEDQPWYVVEWDDEEIRFGQESEESLEPVN